MVREILEALAPTPESVLVDGTTGTGGHSAALLDVLGSRGRLVCLDRDPAMLAMAKSRLEEIRSTRESRPEVTYAATSYHRIGEVLAAAGIAGADGILLDLGLNSVQLDDASRGFTFQADGPLDGRFNPSEEGSRPVSEIVNTAGETELAGWLEEFGDERHARRIARAIVRERAVAPITTTAGLATIIRGAYPAAERHGRIDPATRSMQALRIVANSELEIVEQGVRACMDVLRPGGALAALSYHSGEDRRVKRLFDEAGSPRPDPSNLYRATTTDGLAFEMPKRGALKPGDDEIESNPRARSARLRVIRRRPATGGTQ